MTSPKDNRKKINKVKSSEGLGMETDQAEQLDVLLNQFVEVINNKRAHGLKAQSLKDFILGSSPSAGI